MPPTDTLVAIDVTTSPDRVVDQLADLLLRTSEEVGSVESPLIEFTRQFERISTADRFTVKLAYRMLLRESVGTLHLDITRKTLYALLYLGSKIIRADDQDVRADVRKLIKAAMVNLIDNGDNDLALTCLNSFSGHGFDEQARTLTSWANAIGNRAYLSCFLILARKAPREAVDWLFAQAPGDDVALNTFKVGFYTLMRGMTVFEGFQGSDHSTALIWFQAELASAITDQEARPNLRAELQALMLRGLNGSATDQAADRKPPENTPGLEAELDYLRNLNADHLRDDLFELTN